jgi:lysozyme family protein
MKQRIIEQIIGTEGGYVNDPNDSGGATNFGITRRRARSYGYMGHMYLMTKETAYEIYAKEDWQWINGDALVNVSAILCREVFDCAVNCGASTANKMLQRCLNALSNRTVIVDGKIGPNTLDVLKAYIAKRSNPIILECYKSLRVSHYMSISTRRPKDKKFIHGWVTRACKLDRY